MGLLFALMWSSAYSTARIIVLEVPPLTALSARFAISGALGIGIALLLGQKLRLDRRQWKACVVMGVCHNGICLSANFVSMQWIEASLAAIIASTMPLQVALLNLVAFGIRLNRMGIGGLLVGFVGVVIIMAGRISFGLEFLGVALCLVATIALCFATLAVRQATSGGNLFAIMGIQLWIGCAFVLPPALIFETIEAPNLSFPLIAAFVYQTLVPGMVALWLWFVLVKRVGPTRAAAFHFLNPFLGVMMAVILLGEHAGVAELVGVVVITAGIVAVQMASEYRRPKPLP